MKPIRCGIVDDKPLAIDIIRLYIENVPFLQTSHATTNPLNVLEWVNDKTVDLLFLDIHMPELTGIQIATMIEKTQVRIIFTTAYPDYALTGFDHNAVDYLLKPISFERFYKATLKAKVWFDHSVATASVTSLTVSKPVKTHLFIKVETRLVKIEFDSLLYVQGMENYVVFHTLNGKLMTLQNMKQTEEQLPGNQFVRAHKSFIVNLNKIDSIERNRVFINETVIPVGDTYRESFWRMLTR
jgi:two-component system, LytTR family, response regulator